MLAFFVDHREKLITKFASSLESLNARIEENSNANKILLDENNVLREEYKQKVQQFQEQANLSQKMIEELTEMNVSYGSVFYSRKSMRIKSTR